MPFIAWSPEFSVGIDSIDRQHKRLVELIDILYESRIAGTTALSLPHLLVELRRCKEEHFAFEELCFERTGFPDARRHVEEHRKLTRRLKEFQVTLAHEKLPTTLELLDFLNTWLKDHILGMDKAYADHLRKGGIT
jgi:hemerythrin-like metal-binding protein